MASRDLNFDELEYDPTAFDDINPNDLDTEELEAELAREEAALFGGGDQEHAHGSLSDLTPAAAEETERKEETLENGEKALVENERPTVKTKEGNNRGSRSDEGSHQHRPNRRSNYRPAQHMLGNAMPFPHMAPSPGMPPMMGMGMPYPMMNFPGAGPAMMGFPGTIHINPKFAGNAQVQQQMMLLQQQQQWQQAQQAMAMQQANSMRMPHFNHQQQWNNPNTQKPHGGYRPTKEVSSTTDDAGVKTGRERNIPNGSSKRRPSQDHIVDKKRHQPDHSKSHGNSDSGAGNAVKGTSPDGRSNESPTIANPAVVGGKSSRLIIGNLAASVPETELHRLGKVVPGGVKELLVDRPAGKATLSFQTIDAAVTFRRKYNRTLVGGQHITVSFA